MFFAKKIFRTQNASNYRSMINLNTFSHINRQRSLMEKKNKKKRKEIKITIKCLSYKLSNNLIFYNVKKKMQKIFKIRSVIILESQSLSCLGKHRLFNFHFTFDYLIRVNYHMWLFELKENKCRDDIADWGGKKK